MGIPSHQALVLNPTNLLLGMPNLRGEVSEYDGKGNKLPPASSLREGGLMKTTISKSDNKRSFQLQKEFEEYGDWEVKKVSRVSKNPKNPVTQYYTGVSLARGKFPKTKSLIEEEFNYSKL